MLTDCQSHTSCRSARMLTSVRTFGADTVLPIVFAFADHNVTATVVRFGMMCFGFHPFDVAKVRIRIFFTVFIGFLTHFTAFAEIIISRTRYTICLRCQTFDQRHLHVKRVEMRFCIDRNRCHRFHIATRDHHVCHAACTCFNDTIIAHIDNIRIQSLEHKLSFISCDHQLFTEIQSISDLQNLNAFIIECRDRIRHGFGDLDIITLKSITFQPIIGQNTRFSHQHDGNADIQSLIGNKTEYRRHTLSLNDIVRPFRLFMTKDRERFVFCRDHTIHSFTAKKNAYFIFDVLDQYGTVKDKVDICARRTRFHVGKLRGFFGNHTHINVKMCGRNVKLDAFHAVITVLFKNDFPFTDQNVPTIFTSRIRDIGVRTFTIRFGIPFHPFMSVKIIHRCGNA